MLTQARLKEILHYDPETGVWEWRTRLSANGRIATVRHREYLSINIDKKKYKAHRLAFLYMEGSLPPNLVDHINGEKHDNRWSNLRHATHSENQLWRYSSGTTT